MFYLQMEVYVVKTNNLHFKQCVKLRFEVGVFGESERKLW